MKVIWLCNTLIPEVSYELSLNDTKPESWITAIYNDIKNDRNIKLWYLYPSMENNKIIKKYNTEFISYQEVSSFNVNLLIEYFRNIIFECKPDVIHIFGSEFLHCFAMIQATKLCNRINNTAISIQGLVYEYSNYFNLLIPEKYTKRRTLIERRYHLPSLNDRKINFRIRGSFEIKSIKEVKHVLGRTRWDFLCVKEVNPNVKYHKCNETLRGTFYNNSWNYNRCSKHSVFLSQWYMPYKGLHIAIQIIGRLKAKYPDVKLYTTGKSFLPNTLRDKLLMTNYQKYLWRLIKKMNLKDNIEFCGFLNEEQMCQQYLKSHVYLCSSAIENSPNSLGEAMILGMPCVSTNVGGISSMIVNGKEGFLFEPKNFDSATEYIDRFFSDKELAINFGKNAQNHALNTHNRDINFKRLIEIYDEISKC